LSLDLGFHNLRLMTRSSKLRLTKGSSEPLVPPPRRLSYGYRIAPSAIHRNSLVGVLCALRAISRAASFFTTQNPAKVYPQDVLLRHMSTSGTRADYAKLGGRGADGRENTDNQYSLSTSSVISREPGQMPNKDCEGIRLASEIAPTPFRCLMNNEGWDGGERHRFEDNIGTGAFATVRRAVYTRTGDVLAVKSIQKKPVAQSGKRQLGVRKEVEILEKLNHVSILCINDDDGDHDHGGELLLIH